ncbi:MAG: hypothetical protein AUH85_08375 [Chloroflexi bacterium 13_1_40CM_4_68_4]|nr:MAG: hypothetical protein AUH85_08375 [Chloroflexi bacterium 13_1_40CM_4_68_4]
MTRRQALAITFGAIVLGFVLAGAYYFLAPANTRLAPYTDADYIQTAVQSPAGQAFLAKYPDANRSVDRTAGVIVDLGVVRNGHALDLRLYVDAFADRVLESFAYCDQVQQLMDPVQYLQAERCLGS